ncbi:peptide-methionine (S)-S-oxide reductase, partial [Candidatus Berkelbacteria bacterium]|nr:peptide-methionine (S)-S-oxide reductase [Candidatus Berkelbacteria bacterium]
KKEAQRFIQQLNASTTSGRPIVTQIQPLDQFYQAENYHRDYYARNTFNPYCRVVINPKLAKVKEQFKAFLRSNKS